MTIHKIALAQPYHPAMGQRKDDPISSVLPARVHRQEKYIPRRHHKTSITQARPYHPSMGPPENEILHRQCCELVLPTASQNPKRGNTNQTTPQDANNPRPNPTTHRGPKTTNLNDQPWEEHVQPTASSPSAKNNPHERHLL